MKKSLVTGLVGTSIVGLATGFVSELVKEKQAKKELEKKMKLKLSKLRSNTFIQRFESALSSNLSEVVKPLAKNTFGKNIDWIHINISDYDIINGYFNATLEFLELIGYNEDNETEIYKKSMNPVDVSFKIYADVEKGFSSYSKRKLEYETIHKSANQAIKSVLLPVVVGQLIPNTGSTEFKHNLTKEIVDKALSSYKVELPTEEELQNYNEVIN